MWAWPEESKISKLLWMARYVFMNPEPAPKSMSEATVALLLAGRSLAYFTCVTFIAKRHSEHEAAVPSCGGPSQHELAVTPVAEGSLGCRAPVRGIGLGFAAAP